MRAEERVGRDLTHAIVIVAPNSDADPLHYDDEHHGHDGEHHATTITAIDDGGTAVMLTDAGARWLASRPLRLLVAATSLTGMALAWAHGDHVVSAHLALGSHWN